ncbi:MAG: ATP-binding protein [Candidatus Shapirobacteria bacterium]
MNNKLYILCGIPFSGKSTLAKKIVEKLGFTRIDLDEIKFEMFGKDITDSQINQSGWDKIYQEMYQRIRNKLLEGNTVIHDTGNFTKYERGLVKKIANEIGVDSTTILVNISEEEAHKRLLENRETKSRFDVSDSDFQSTVKEMEKPDNSEKHLIFQWYENQDKWIDDNLLIK